MSDLAPQTEAETFLAAPAPTPEPAPEPEPVPEPPAAEAKVKRGQLVAHSWTDPTGEHTRYALVVAVHEDGANPDRATVAWLETSGPILVDELEPDPVFEA